jgi:hypothetical protein
LDCHSLFVAYPAEEMHAAPNTAPSAHRAMLLPLVRMAKPGLDLVALDLAGGATRQVCERDEADVFGLLVDLAGFN